MLLKQSPLEFGARLASFIAQPTEKGVAKEKIMNKLWGGILVLACAGAAYGEFSSQDTIRFTTPFAFHLGDKLVPAGEYTIRWQQDFHVLVLQSPAESAMSYALNGVSASGGVSAERSDATRPAA